MSFVSIISELENLKNAIQSDNFEAIDSALESLGLRYEELSETESARLEKIKRERFKYDESSEEWEEFKNYQEERSKTKILRGSILTAGAIYDISPNLNQKTEIIDKISQLQSAEESLRESANEVDSSISDSEIPPKITVLSITKPEGQVIVNQPTRFETTILNIGDNQANSINVEIESELTVTSASQQISELSPKNKQTIDFEVEGTSSGEYNIAVTASSENAGNASQNTTINVSTLTDLYRSVVVTLQELAGQITNNSSIPEDNSNDLTSTLDSAITSIEQAITNLEEDNQGRANESIRTATIQIGQFLNSFEELSGLSPAFSRLITNNAELAIEQLSETVEILSIVDAIDQNDNNQIDDEEILRAIELWRSNEPVPGTGGKTIGDTKILELIDLWRNTSPIR